MKTINVVPVISTAIYAAGDALGGLMTFTLPRNPKTGGRIIGITLIDKDNLRVACDVFLYDASVATGTDNAAYQPTDADSEKAIGVVPIIAGDYVDGGLSGIATKRDLNIPFQSGVTLFGQLVTRGTPTHTGTSQIMVRLHVQFDVSA